MDGAYTEQYSFDKTSHRYSYQVSEIYPGGYIAISSGLIYYIQGSLHLDFSMGLETSLNTFEGNMPSSSLDQHHGTITKSLKATSNFHIMIEVGF